MIKTTVYLPEEIKKLIAAYKEKYNISDCDAPPYNPKGLEIYLTGSTAEPVEENYNSEKLPGLKKFNETFDHNLKAFGEKSR